MSLNQMREIDIRTVDINTLVDARAVSVDMDLPKPERMSSVINQMGGNPYFMRSGDVAVKIGFIDTPVSLDERMESFLRTL